MPSLRMIWPLRRTAIIAAALLAAALAVRIGQVQRTSYTPINDGGSYLKLAREVANTGDYSQHDPGAAGSKGPSAYFPPAYPYFLAGVHVFDSSVSAARLSQALLGTVTVGLIGLVAFELLGVWLALLAMAIAAFYPVLIGLSAVLVAENLLVALELAALWSVLRARRASRRTGWIVAAGILTGLATLTHQNALVLLIPFGIALWLPGPRRLVAPLLLIGVTILTIAPWTVRNAVELHRFIPVSDEAGITLAGTYNPISAADHTIPYGWRLYLPRVSSKRLPEAELGSRLLSRAARYIRDHPTAPIKAGFYNSLRLLDLEGSFAWKNSAASIGLDRGTARIAVISFWVMFVFAIAGVITPTGRRLPTWLWLIPLLLALSVVLVNAETPRFREPIEPFLILPAACAVGAIVARLRGAPVRRERGSVLARP